MQLQSITLIILYFVLIFVFVDCEEDEEIFMINNCESHFKQNFTNVCHRTLYPLHMKLKYDDVFVDVLSVYRVLQDQANPGRYLILFSNVNDISKIYFENVKWIQFIDKRTFIRGFLNEEERKQACHMEMQYRFYSWPKPNRKALNNWELPKIYWNATKFTKDFYCNNKTEMHKICHATKWSDFDFEKAFVANKYQGNECPQNLTYNIEWFKVVIFCEELNFQYMNELIHYCNVNLPEATSVLIYYYAPIFPTIKIVDSLAAHNNLNLQMTFYITILILLLHKFL